MYQERFKIVETFLDKDKYSKELLFGKWYFDNNGYVQFKGMTIKEAFNYYLSISNNIRDTLNYTLRSELLTSVDAVEVNESVYCLVSQWMKDFVNQVLRWIEKRYE